MAITTKSKLLDASLNKSSETLFDNIADSVILQEVKLIGAGAGQTLSAADSGKTIVFKDAEATLIKLPEPQLGMTFHFVSAITATGDHEIQALNDGHGFVGGLSIVSTTVAKADYFPAAANGADDFITMNGGTTGGAAGSFVTCRAILGASAAKAWLVNGVLAGVGSTMATPFANS